VITPGGSELNRILREKNVDDVLQIENVFTNVGKGEVAKSNDIKKAFGTDDIHEVVKEVSKPQYSFQTSSTYGRPRF
jgi:ribosome maturation protein Sdo1